MIATLWLALVALGLLADLTFCGLYAYTAPGWYRSQIGQNLMATSAVLAGLLALSLAARVVALPVWLFVGGMATLDAVLWWRVLLLWRVQRRR